MQIRVIGALIFATSVLFAEAELAQAAFVFDITQSGLNVSINGAGSLNTSGLTVQTTGTGNFPGVQPSQAFLDAGPANLQSPTVAYSGTSGPSQFGGGTFRFTASGSGDIVGVTLGTTLIAPSGYVSGSVLSDSDVITNQTLSSIGLTPGTYIYTWGTGPTADSLTINVGTVPEPATAAVLAIPATLALLRRRRGPR